MSQALCKIGLIKSSGDHNKAAEAMFASAQHIVQSRKQQLQNAGIDIELVVLDDFSDASTSCQKAKQLVSQGCLAVIGPTDSHSFHQILLSNEVADVPIFATIASASFLSSLQSQSFFRFTKSDYFRAEKLLLNLSSTYANVQDVLVYSLAGPEFSYGQQLKCDITQAAREHRINVIHHDFSRDNMPAVFPAKNEPAVVCAQSAHVVELATHLRAHKCRSQLYTFGSNSNLLNSLTVNSIVATDLDRDETDSMIGKELTQYFADFPDVQDADTSTMNALCVLCNYLTDNPNVMQQDIANARQSVINHLRQPKAKRTLNGDITFLENGEMAGDETISLLRVKKRFNRYSFVPLSKKTKPHYYMRWNSIGVVSNVINILGVVVGVVGIVVTLINFI
ncbi:hypothetical protein [Neptunicella marina]|uniref:Receptor ligand binding region domain-containing protein n=1 Tax=Neptunicella marina TaxID=2125989 RepID=A0A8J6ISL5_9ALTE|nr:hypothetical protein [Neptunicella marina]MBC3765664.1 hypothetical protein [Neptunicella marina]